MLFKKIDAASKDSVSSGFNLFDVPETDVSFSSAEYVEVLTLNPVNAPPYHFKLPKGSSFLDLNKSYIKSEMKLQKSDNGGAWEDVVAADNASVCQGIGMNWMKNLKITLEGRLIYNSNSLQAYKNYMDVTCSYSPQEKSTYLAVAGWHEDGDSQTAGSGWEARRNLFTGGKTAQFITKINADLFNQERYFLNNTDLEIEIQPHETNYLVVAPALAANVEVRLIITDVRLYVKQLNAMDGLSLSINKVLDKQPARYPLKLSSLKTHYLDPGRTEASINLSTDQIPCSILAMLVPTNNYNGSIATSPFQANPFDIIDFRILWNGLQSPHVPYHLDFPNAKVARAFYDFYENTGLGYTPYTNGITLPKFMNGWTFFMFNLTSNLENNREFNLQKEGNTSGYLRFRSPIPAGGATLIVYATYDSLMNIDKNRTVTTDVSV